MILLDTHIWIWWVSEPRRLSANQREEIEKVKHSSLGVSAISCWEVAKLVELERLTLDRPVEEWMRAALTLPNINLIELTPEIAVASTRLPGVFHRDPADQLIVATARLLGYRLATLDHKILKYEHVETHYCPVKSRRGATG